MKKKHVPQVPRPVSLLLLFLFFSSYLFSQDIIALQKMKNYVLENKQQLGLSADDAATLSLTHEYTDASTGIHHMYATQKINGVTVTNTTFALHSTGTKNYDVNELISTKNYNVRPLSLGIISSQAVSKLMDAVNYQGPRNVEVKQAAQGTEQVTVYKRGTSFIWDIPCRIVYYNNSKLKTLQPAWEVQMMDLYKKHYWLAYIDASSGKVLEKRDLILKCDFGGAATDADAMYHKNHKHHFVEAGSAAADTKQVATGLEANKFFAIIPNSYRVYDLPLESPGDTIQQAAPHAISTRSGDTLASPDGWHRTAGGAVPYQYTRGNNVWAFQDPSPGPLGGVPSSDPSRTAYNNGGPLGAPVPVEPFVFDYPVDLAADPTVYQKGAIVNLFYWNNLMHDVFYYLGFTEAAGNFQESPTFSTGTRAGGSSANDAVLAQAQDGGGTNNANFLTTPDGTPGQMQMYLWTAAFPDSLVHITSSSSGIPPSGKKYVAIQGSFNALPADTANTNLYTNPKVDKQFVIIQKNPLSTVGSDSEGCTTGQQSIALPPGNNVQDKIVLIDRGNCSFIEKVLSAQQGGAAGVIIINNTPGPPIAMGGSDAPGNAVRIPAVMISQADGEELKAQIRAGANIIGSLKRNSPPPPKRDGDLDNGVIAHEYGHGISNRMTAPNTVGPLGGSEQGGEGWSDFMALYMTMRTNDLLPATPGHPNGVLPTRSIGNYVTYQQAEGRGIRPTPYSLDRSVNPSTFKDIGKGGEISIPHGVGYIWCTMMYEMLQAFIDQYGMGDNVYEGANPVAQNPPTSAKGNNIAMRLIMEGMKLQGTSPTFVRQRNAILRADTLLYNAQHSCMIWRAFASRGLGFSATSGTNGVGDEFEAYDVPFTGCDPTQKRVSIVKTGPVKLNNGAPANYTINVTNKYNAALNAVTVTDTLPSGLTFVSASEGGALNGNVVSWTLNFLPNETKSLTLNTTVNSAATSIQSFGDDHETATANWTPTNNGGIDTWTKQTNASQAFSGTNYWYVPDTDGISNTTLSTTNPIAIPPNAELVFIHKYATEKGFDGGVVEVLEQDSVVWRYLPPNKFVKGGYNGVIDPVDNPAIGTSVTAAFTGVSDGYIVSVARLDDYANKNIRIRFRFTTDVGTNVTPGGWWMDDVYILLNRSEVANKANAITTPGAPMLAREGTNATSSTSAFVLGSNPLPGSLGALSAVVVRQSVSLSWKTYNEVNTSSFDIERKGTGETNFVKVGTVSPNTNGAQTRSYTFSDPTVASGNRYQYRIRQVNRNGEAYFSNVALVNLGGKSFAADVYPNPAKNVANLSIINPDGGKVTISLFDVLGKKVATFIGAEAQSQVIPLPVTGLKAGTYWIEVNTNENRKTLKLVIDK